MLDGNKKLASFTLRGADGKLISDPSDRVKRWTEYHEQLLNPSKVSPPIASCNNNNNAQQPVPLLPKASSLMAQITREEVKNALTQAKKWRAPGPDEVTAELLLSCKAWSLPWMVELFNLCLQAQKVP
jgi:hypothetical protein